MSTTHYTVGVMPSCIVTGTSFLYVNSINRPTDHMIVIVDLISFVKSICQYFHGSMCWNSTFLISDMPTSTAMTSLRELRPPGEWGGREVGRRHRGLPSKG